jgi:hypothetical protein
MLNPNTCDTLLTRPARSPLPASGALSASRFGATQKVREDLSSGEEREHQEEQREDLRIPGMY